MNDGILVHKVSSFRKTMGAVLAGYIRVSTEMQAERDSVINQEESIVSYAKSKGRDYILYKDIGISAKDKDRPGFQEMIDEIKAGKIDTVVVSRLDRVTRSLKDLIYLKELFDEHNIFFVSITQNLDTSTPMGRFSFYVLGLVAQLEREVTAERVAEDMRARAKRKKWNGGIVPYGFTAQVRLFKEYLKNGAKKILTKPSGIDKEDKRTLKEMIKKLESDSKTKEKAQQYARNLIPETKMLFVDPEEAIVVRKIFNLFLKHRSFRGTVHALNSLGLKTREGKPWPATTIRRILQNPMYYGALTYNKRRSVGKTSKPRPKEEHIIVDDVFEPIIPKKKFEEVQEIIASNRRTPPVRTDSAYLLSGLLKCGKCGGNMYGTTYSDKRPGRSTYQYYRCNAHIQKGSAVCSGSTIDMKFIDDLIINELKEFKINPDKLKNRVKDFHAQMEKEWKPLLEQHRRFEQGLKKMEIKSDRLLELYEDSLIDKNEFIKRKATLDAEKELLKKNLEEVNSGLFCNRLTGIDIETTLAGISNLSDVYEELDLVENKELLRTLISDIKVREHEIDYTIFALPNSLVSYSRTDAPVDFMGIHRMSAIAPPYRFRNI